MTRQITRSLKTIGLVSLTLLFYWTQQTTAQTNSTQQSEQVQSTPRSHHKRGRMAGNLKVDTTPSAAAAAKPTEPPKPDWPVNDPPVKATVSWDSKGLRIEASNSSLEAILKEVTAETGVTVEGLDKDQRIFGVYGPGRARDVLAQLLEGTGYNVLIIGEQSPGTPREVVLSTRTEPTTNGNNNTTARTAPVAEEDEETPEPVVNSQQTNDEQQNPSPMRPGFQNMPHQNPPLIPGQQGQQTPQE